MSKAKQTKAKKLKAPIKKVVITIENTFDDTTGANGFQIKWTAGDTIKMIIDSFNLGIEPDDGTHMAERVAASSVLHLLTLVDQINKAAELNNKVKADMASGITYGELKYE